MKLCTKCKLPGSYYKNKLSSDGLQSWCKKCHLADRDTRRPNYKEVEKKYNNLDRHAASEAKRRSAKLKRTPKWADLELIKMYYKRADYLTRCTGIQWSVDHIIPLQGVNISGLHVANNLRVITHSENSAKRNW